MREYITLKYGPIVEEFCVFYDQLRDKYPTRNVYKNTKEFRQWVKGEISKYIEDETSSSNNAAGQIEHADREIRDTEQDDEASSSNNAAGQIEHADREIRDTEQDDEASSSNNAAGQIEHADREIPDTEQDDEASSSNNAAGQIEHADREIQDIINELENGGVPLSHSDDEGIKLDLYEELQGITEDFDFDQEVNMNDNVFW